MTHPSTLDLDATQRRPHSAARRPRLALGRLWPWVPALLLGSLIGAQMTVLSFVLDDPTFATEEDYYRKAVDWDARMLRERQSDALGWRARLDAPSSVRSRLSLRLEDAQGNPVSQAEVKGVAFHNARAGQPIVLMLDEVSPGRYQVELGTVRPGLWELRLHATRERDSYETTERFDVLPAGSAAP